MKKTFHLFFLLIAILFFASCSDNSSSADENGDENSSSSEENSEKNIPADSIKIDENGFVDIGDLFNSIQENEKVVFIIRHAERESRVTKDAELTDEGKVQAFQLGEKIKSDDTIYFSHTDFVRTEQTCENIAKGRGQKDFIHDTVVEINSDWYIKNDSLKKVHLQNKDASNSKVLVSQWAFEGDFDDTFYDLKTKSEEIINKFLISDYNNMHKFRLICTHDEFLVPFTVYVTKGAIDYRFYDVNSRKWINYLSGIAIVVNDKNEIKFYPIKSMESGLS
ncbi:MAG: histidine phosphatase family protein [Fibrobacter sp.]|nr:histidine phosphatase family protein [Fibrobacter sp.]